MEKKKVFFHHDIALAQIAGQTFESNAEVIAVTEAYFVGLPKPVPSEKYVSDRLKKLDDRWVNCIELKGDVEK